MKDLELERKFALQDHVESEESITEQEEKALRKAIVKTNEDWKREAEAMNSYGSMVITRDPRLILQRNKCGQTANESQQQNSGETLRPKIP